MSGRVLLTVIFVLALIAAGLLTAPVFSGEHPWDSDRTGGRSSGGPVIPAGHPDTVTIVDTAVTPATTTPTATLSSGWAGVISAVWSAMMVI